MLNTQHKIELSDIEIDENGNDHVSSCYNNPIREDAFEKTDDEKIEIIADYRRHFGISFIHIVHQVLRWLHIIIVPVVEI